MRGALCPIIPSDILCASESPRCLEFQADARQVEQLLSTTLAGLTSGAILSTRCCEVSYTGRRIVAL